MSNRRRVGTRAPAEASREREPYAEGLTVGGRGAKGITVTEYPIKRVRKS